MSAYFEYDGSSRFLLQYARQAERLQVRVWVIHKAGIVVGEQSLHVVEDEAKLVHVFDGLLVGCVLGLQGRCETADGGGVQHLTHLEVKHSTCVSILSGRQRPIRIAHVITQMLNVLINNTAVCCMIHD